jgi:endonuclease I
MKKFYTLAFLLLAAVGFAQPPAGYYNTATGTGYTLKTQLYNIINGHNDRGYAGLYVTYTTSDKDFYYENNGTMLDMYTENPLGPECEFTYGVNQDDGTLGNNECERYNREHLVPQSVFGSATPMYSDAHFVVPSDKHVNAERADFPFGRVGTATFTATNGGKKGQNVNSGYSAGYSGVVFEPINEFKGDIARCLLYFATRYEDVVAGYSYTMFDDTSTKVFTPTFLNILLTWNQLDPVSAREVSRNNAIYARQGNRNPFIDNNSYVTNIWGAPLAIEDFDVLASVSVYPNPTNNHTITIQSAAALDNIQLLTINGQMLREYKNPAATGNYYVLENLPQGFYFVKLYADEHTTTKKIVVN